jgi:hypothetical protein
MGVPHRHPIPSEQFYTDCRRVRAFSGLAESEGIPTEADYRLIARHLGLRATPGARTAR